MADKNKHNLRSKEPRNDRPLQIIKEIGFYDQFPKEFENNNDKLIENYKSFMKKDIYIPGAEKEKEYKRTGLLSETDKKVVDKSSELTSKTHYTDREADKVSVKIEANTKPAAFSEKKEVRKVMVPDMFGNMKIKNPVIFLRYRDLHPPTGKGKEVPEHLVKYIEPVNSENQNTVEKWWSFHKKLYEITEEKIRELKLFNIDISPSDYEWVIDIFEKTAINDEQQSISYLIEKFRCRAFPDVSDRVSDEQMKMIYNKCWKNQRE